MYQRLVFARRVQLFACDGQWLRWARDVVALKLRRDLGWALKDVRAGVVHGLSAPVAGCNLAAVQSLDQIGERLEVIAQDLALRLLWVGDQQVRRFDAAGRFVGTVSAVRAAELVAHGYEAYGRDRVVAVAERVARPMPGSYVSFEDGRAVLKFWRVNRASAGRKFQGPVSQTTTRE